LKPAYLIILLALNFCWAAVYSAYKVLGNTLPTGGIVTLRFGLAALCMLVIWPWLPGVAPRGRDLAKTILLGIILYPIGQRLQVYGSVLGGAGDSAVLMSLEPLLTSVAAALFLREHIGPRRLAGFCLGMLGVVLLNGVWRPDFKWTGLGPSLIFISSFICEAAFSVVGKPIVQRASPYKMVAITLLVGTAANFVVDGPTTLSAARTLTAGNWVLIFLMAVICTVIGYCAWFVIIRHCPINVAALTIFTQAVFGVIIAAIWLGEKPHWGQIWGSAAIVVGLVLGLSRQVRTQPET
jgi:drug/metabolite transporter (DMT)-like permease